MTKKLICTAVGASLVAASGLAFAYQNPGADVAFAPYVVKDTNRTTVVTVIMDSNSTTPASDEVLHLQYWTKSTTAANTAACEPSSVTVPVTDNDIVTWDTAGILGYPLFGDTTNPSPLGMAISYAAPRHGYLVIEAPVERNGSNEIRSTYWLELDLANGGAIGDYAQLDSNANFEDEWGTAQILAPDSSSNPSNSTAVPFWPSSVASTAFTVTPLGSDMVNRENNQVVVQILQGAYDRNENGVDGTVPVTVRCVGRVTPAQLMPGVVANAAWASQGGWGFFANLGDGDTSENESQSATSSGDLDALVYQVDTSSAGGKFLSNATRIVTYQGYD